MKILVTGGGGFLGQALCRALRERGHEVVSFQRRHSPELAALGVGQVRGDLADANAVMHAAAGVDATDPAARSISSQLPSTSGSPGNQARSDFSGP